jgi:uncharacterized membrane protein YtjA (UPF0391 family)
MKRTCRIRAISLQNVLSNAKELRSSESRDFTHDHEDRRKSILITSLPQWSFICTQKERGREMLYYALVFLAVALIAAFLGFGGAAVAFAGIAKLLFFLFLILFVVSLVMHVGRRA